jgi:hypothetical protein
MKNFCIFVALIFIWVISCSKESTAVYWERGMVEISLGQTGRIDFFVPDQGDSGWNYNDPGADTVTLDFSVKNLSDMELSLSGIYWQIHAGDYWIWADRDERVPPIIFPAHDSTAIQVQIIINENCAHQIDQSDGIDDYSGTGTFKFSMTGYDNEYYEDIRSNYIYTEMSVAKP